MLRGPCNTCVCYIALNTLQYNLFSTCKNISCCITKHDSNCSLIFKRKHTPQRLLNKTIAEKSLEQDIYEVVCNSDNKYYILIYSYCIIVHFNLTVFLQGFFLTSINDMQ